MEKPSFREKQEVTENHQRSGIETPLRVAKRKTVQCFQEEQKVHFVLAAELRLREGHGSVQTLDHLVLVGPRQREELDRILRDQGQLPTAAHLHAAHQRRQQGNRRHRRQDVGHAHPARPRSQGNIGERHPSVGEVHRDCPWNAR